MTVGVFTVLYQQLPFEDLLDKVAALGIDAGALGTGQ
ncbi:sugar phosphate isomerase/epimerase, partial [Anoxybacillus geothermalis]|nr:sugar phosphate isomerase/epimerase [Anoxybacillus geothermalis]